MNNPLSNMYLHVRDALDRDDVAAACACDIAPLAQSERHHLLWKASRHAQWEFVRQKIDDGFVDDNAMLSIFWNAAQYQQDDICKHMIDRLTGCDEGILKGCCKSGYDSLLGHLLSTRPISDEGLLNMLITDTAVLGHHECLRILLDHIPPQDMPRLSTSSIPIAIMQSVHMGHEECFSMLWPLVADKQMTATSVALDALNKTSVKIVEVLMPYLSWADLASTNVVCQVLFTNDEAMSHFVYHSCPSDLHPTISENVKNAVDPEVWEQSFWAALDQSRQTRSALRAAIKPSAPSAKPSKM